MSTFANNFSKIQNAGAKKPGKQGAYPVQWMEVKEVARYLGKSQNTIINWCRSGKLQAIPMDYGSKQSFRIPSVEAIVMKEALRAKEVNRIAQGVSRKRSSVNHADLIQTYIRYCEQGLQSEDGRPYAASTLYHHQYNLTKFLQKYPEVSAHNLKTELLAIPKELFGKREKLVRVLTSFSKWLVQENMMDEEEAQNIAKIKVKRFNPPKQVSLREDELEMMEKACKNSYERCIVVMLSNTGLRNSEFCSLTMQNISLERREIKCRGKGNKERWVGLTSKAYNALVEYLAEHPPINDKEPIFRSRFGEPLQRYGLRYRLQEVAERVGLDAAPHAMRRTFVTLNAAKGRSLVDLQLACGHNQISTTRMYCKTQQEEVVNRMKDWD